MTELHAASLPGLPEIELDDDVAALVATAVAQSEKTIEAGDVFVVAQKIVSKAEGAIVRLDDVNPSPRAEQWAREYAKDARIVEVVLRESRRIVRMERGIIIAETHHGFVCANAGVDASNVPRGLVTILPRDADASAARIRETLVAAFGCPVGVIVSDTFGRPWREGVVNVALGVAGLRPLLDYRGCSDAYGRRLESTVMAVADELASAAELVMRKTTGTPVAIVRGAGEWIGEGTGRMLLRNPQLDLFK
jgi:coenzyme F420-0:L-glutamate ligase/coenzyme F420-1:gamma-L-glutamate ligase